MVKFTIRIVSIEVSCLIRTFVKSTTVTDSIDNFDQYLHKLLLGYDNDSRKILIGLSNIDFPAVSDVHHFALSMHNLSISDLSNIDPDQSIYITDRNVETILPDSQPPKFLFCNVLNEQVGRNLTATLWQARILCLDLEDYCSFKHFLTDVTTRIDFLVVYTTWTKSTRNELAKFACLTRSKNTLFVQRCFLSHLNPLTFFGFVVERLKAKRNFEDLFSRTDATDNFLFFGAPFLAGDASELKSPYELLLKHPDECREAMLIILHLASFFSV